MTCDGGRPSERADVAALAARVRAAAPGLGPVRLVCVDGPAGSGKSTLAGVLATALADDAEAPLAVALLHPDDFYEGWSGGFAPELGDRLERQVLAPLRAGLAGRWRRFDWVAGEFAEWRELPVPDVLVIEGCGSADARVAAHAVLSVYVEAPPRVRMRRGIERDGEGMHAEWVRWQVRESAHFEAQRTRQRADVVVDGTLEPVR